MRALALRGFETSPAVIDVPVPEPQRGEVLVRIRAASVNAYDLSVAMGMMKDYLPYEFPAVIGQDVAGVVESVGPDVERFHEGDRVFGTIGRKGVVHDGTFAELSTPQAPAITLTPDGVDDESAGSLGVAGTTAMSAVEAAGIREGSMIVIVGATGGVGTFAIQLATLQGAHVIATARPGDETFVMGLGAAETVDYAGDLAETLRARYPDGVDALLDLVHRDQGEFATLVGLVRDGGRSVSVVGAAGDATAIGNVAVTNAGGDPSHLDALGALVGEGKVRVAINRRYPLREAGRALTDFTDEHTLGKRVITMPDA